MTRSKLSASDREELIRLFKETTETITSLADQFQVSISTARRVLKTQLSAEEYEAIVTNRLEGRQNKKNVTTPTPTPQNETEIEKEDESQLTSDQETLTHKTKIPPPIPRPKRRSRRRSSAEEEAILNEASPVTEHPEQIEEAPSDLEAPVASMESSSPPISKKRRVASAETSRETPQPPVPKSSPPIDASETVIPLEVHPIATATLPHQCYLVVDRASELITPPLGEFSELGNIPSAEESAKTLPIFENHKIASRFSRRSQRIIKIPNSDILKKTYPLLNAKGVERILFDGQVFSLT